MYQITLKTCFLLTPYTRQCALGVRAINNWNSLTDNIVLSDNINKFKTRLERFWSGKESKFDPTG